MPDEKNGEEPDIEEFLGWLCWCRAMDGERFYPPEETAEACMDAVQPVYDENDDMSEEYGFGVEVGQHSRAWSDAVEFFTDAQSWGLDPVERAERHLDETREDGLDLDDLDWSWLRESRYEWGNEDA